MERLESFDFTPRDFGTERVGGTFVIPTLFHFPVDHLWIWSVPVELCCDAQRNFNGTNWREFDDNRK